ncbi:hypothetical protein WJX73_010067 [Symbiochloris irregularis]|uniref:Signal recognition particle 19 kDa protein n=1 Tax=Symbiochloris irregularis TaxID=706552 RepID=A0AAW1NW25_9CHLO
MSVEHDRRVIIYPAYINSKRTVAQGRRIPKEKACEDPTAPEIVDCVVKGLNIPGELEPKSYCRDFFLRGRVRVSLRKPDGTLTNPNIPNRKLLFLKVAELVPKHPSRHGKKIPASAKGVIEAPQPSTSTAAGPSAGPSAAQSSKKGKKKGRK